MYKSIKITDPEILEFLSEHKENKEIQAACVRVLKDFIITTKELLKQHVTNEDNKKREESMLSMLRSLEQRQQEYSKQLEQNLKESLKVTLTEMLQTTTKMLAMMVDSFSNRFNVDTILATMTESLKMWLESQMTSCTSKIQLSVSSFQNQVREELYRLTYPLSSTQDKILEEVRNLPSKIDVNMNIDVEIQRLSSTLLSCHDRMHEVRSSMKDIEGVMKVAMTKVSESKDLTLSQQKAVTQAISNVPLMTKGVLCEMLKSLEDKNTTIMMALTDTKAEMKRLQESMRENLETMGQLKTHTQTLTYKVDEVDKRIMTKYVKEENSNQIKGADGESRLINELSEKLLARDGYKITHVSGMAHSCDILIQKMNHPDIRIEVKAHQDKVRYKEVEKFKSDLHMLNNHGIFVSLHNGIVGVSDFEIEQQPTGKFAVYLAHNNYDMDVVVSMILLLYRLDVITRTQESDKITIESDTIIQIKNMIKEYMSKLQVVKTHLKESMTIIGNIQMDAIEKMLLNDKPKEQRDEIGVGYICQWCEKEYESGSALGGHKRFCKNRPQVRR